ncbi:MAG: tetratricopeptide repeat protein [Gemmatales bacterium]|nr:tetratricopeptide repeat protein [Gemmatales bacterium]MDW8387208.1 tetratricopeptide repeat protein [Gemmatales bacterium]
MFKHSLSTIVLSVLLGVVLALGLYVGYLFLFPPGEESLLTRGQERYQSGLRQLEAGEAERAKSLFTEALTEANKVLEKLQERLGQGTERPQEAIEADRTNAAKAFWLRALALRGIFISDAILEGKAISPLGREPLQRLASADDINKVPMTFITDTEMQKEAVVATRQAALRLTDDPVVQETALFTEIQYPLENWNWDLISRFADNVLKQNPKDARALYALARFEYEQPVPRSGGSRGPAAPSPVGRRTKERMEKSLEYVTRLKEVEAPNIRWRTLDLEAQARLWLLGFYRSPAGNSPAQAAEQQAALRAMLYDPVQGIRKRAESIEDFMTLTISDQDGLVGLHRLAVDLALEDARIAGRADPATHARLIEALESVMTLARRMAAAKSVPRHGMSRILETAVIAVGQAQPYLTGDSAHPFSSYLEGLQTLVDTCIRRKAATPLAFVGLTELLAREAALAAKEGQSARKAALDAEIERWVEKALAYAETEKIPAGQLLPLHEQAARMKLLKGAKRADIMPHLRALQQSQDVNLRSTGLLIEGLLAEREGKLEQAQNLLEQAANLDRNGPNHVRSHLVLINVYTALGKPDLALRSIAAVRAAYGQLERLSSEERAWAKEFIRDEKELDLLEFQAHLQTAQLKYVNLMKAAEQEQRNPRTRPVASGRPTVTGRPGGESSAEADAALSGIAPKVGSKPTPAVAAALRPHEEAAGQLLKKLPPNSPMERLARQLEVVYWSATGRLADAEAALASLKRDYPDNLQVLRLEMQMQVAKDPKEAPTRIEALIQDYLKNYPQEIGGRLLWAEWLIRTGREAQAVAYLEDPANFPTGANDPRVNGLRVVAYSRLGDREKTLEAAQLLPPDPAAEALKIRLAATSVEDMQKQIREEMSRSEGNAVLTYMNANLSFLKRDYVDAAKGYLQAMEFTRVRGAARQGVLNALLALAQENPEKALDLSTQMLQDYPGEPELLLGYAYACLLLDRIGDPKQRSDRPKDMSSALDQAERAFTVNRNDRISGPLAKARFWMWAGRPDLARTEVKRALAIEARNTQALLLGARLAAESTDAADIGLGLEYVKWLKEKENPPAEALLLEGQLLERDGKLNDAIKSYESFVDRTPTISTGYGPLVSALIKASLYERALEWIQRWKTRIPTDPNIGHYLVQVLGMMGRTAEAKQAAANFLAEQDKLWKERAANLKPTGAVPAEEFEKQKKQLVDAQMDLVKLALSGGFFRAKMWDDAEALVRDVLARQPESVEAQLRLADIYLTKADEQKDHPDRKAWLQQAKRSYEAVYAAHKGHFIAGNNLAWLLVKEEKDPEAALRYLQEVRTGRFSKQPIAPERLPADLLDTFGEVYEALNKPEHFTAMRDMFEAARLRYPNDPRMFLHLGNAYAGLGDAAKARSMYAAAISLANQPARSMLKDEDRKAVIEEAKAKQSALPR